LNFLHSRGWELEEIDGDRLSLEVKTETDEIEDDGLSLDAARKAFIIGVSRRLINSYAVRLALHLAFLHWAMQLRSKVMNFSWDSEQKKMRLKMMDLR